MQSDDVRKIESGNPVLLEDIDVTIERFDFKPASVINIGRMRLDLYRLLAMLHAEKVLADPPATPSERRSVMNCRNDFLGTEILRILVETAIQFRMLMDTGAADKSVGEMKIDGSIIIGKSGELLKDLKSSQKAKDMSLRDALNKIVHATYGHFDGVAIVSGNERIPMQINERIDFFGEYGGLPWRCNFSLSSYAMDLLVCLDEVTQKGP